MKALEKIKLFDEIATELQSRMTFADIDLYFSALGIKTDHSHSDSGSKRVYAKEVLAKVSEDVIFTIATELGIIKDSPNSALIVVNDATFWKAGYFKLFLSHLASFKVQTSRLQSALKKYGISSFVAHEDIEPSREWQNEIESALHTMDALAAILMEGFKESNWCDQEVGFAVGKNVLVIPVRRGLDPYGFIGKYQGIQAKDKTVSEVADAIFKTLISSPKTRMKMLNALSNAIAQSTDTEDAIQKLLALKSIDNLPIDLLNSFSAQVKENRVLNDSTEFIAITNSLLSHYKLPNVSIGHQAKEKGYDESTLF